VRVGSNESIRHHSFLLLEQLGDSKVSQLDNPALIRQKDVVWLDIAMQDMSKVAVFEAEQNLH